MDQVKLAKGLGSMGIGLGLTEMLAPEWLARRIGMDEDRTTILRAMGRKPAEATTALGSGRSSRAVDVEVNCLAARGTTRPLEGPLPLIVT